MARWTLLINGVVLLAMFCFRIVAGWVLPQPNPAPDSWGESWKSSTAEFESSLSVALICFALLIPGILSLLEVHRLREIHKKSLRRATGLAWLLCAWLVLQVVGLQVIGQYWRETRQVYGTSQSMSVISYAYREHNTQWLLIWAAMEMLAAVLVTVAFLRYVPPTKQLGGFEPYMSNVAGAPPAKPLPMNEVHR